MCSHCILKTMGAMKSDRPSQNLIFPAHIHMVIQKYFLITFFVCGWWWVCVIVRDSTLERPSNIHRWRQTNLEIFKPLPILSHKIGSFTHYFIHSNTKVASPTCVKSLMNVPILNKKVWFILGEVINDIQYLLMMIWHRLKCECGCNGFQEWIL